MNDTEAAAPPRLLAHVLAERRITQFADATHYARTTDAIDRLLSAVAPHQWSAPTPCAQWDLARLTEHLIDANYTFAQKLEATPGTTYVKEGPAHAAVDRFRISARHLQRALTAEGDGEALPAHLRERLALRVADLLIHGWDIATATGQLAQLPDDVTEEALAFARRRAGALRRSGQFAPAQPVDEHAPALLRLVALSGRPVPRWPG
ncbi:MAG: TIGR03086 family metal-binding protein [Mycobacterium sp.]